MNESISFFVPGVPRTAGSKRAFVIQPKDGGRPRAIVTDANVKGKDWRNDIRHALGAVRNLSVAPLAVPLVLRVTFVMPRPKAHFRSNGELKPTALYYCDKRPDATKMLRAVEDALNSVLWVDDALIVSQTVEKIYGVPTGARINVTMALPKGA